MSENPPELPPPFEEEEEQSEKDLSRKESSPTQNLRIKKDESSSHFGWESEPAFLNGAKLNFPHKPPSKPETAGVHLAISKKQSLELQLKIKNLLFLPGQFIYINCTYLDSKKWLPFYITSTPNEPTVSIQVSKEEKGWKRQLWTLLNPRDLSGIVEENLSQAPDRSPIFRWDGPFGRSIPVINRLDAVLIIVSGFGTDKAASLMKAAFHEISLKQKLKHMYFVWIQPSHSQTDFWFSDLVYSLSKGKNIESHMYFTHQMPPAEPLPKTQGVSVLWNKKPDFDLIFTKIKSVHSESDIGVIYCGPQLLAKELDLYSKQFSRTTQTGLSQTVFSFFDITDPFEE